MVPDASPPGHPVSPPRRGGRAILSGVGATARSSPPLVGRDEELLRLEQGWRQAGSLWLIEGPAGIGKSRLVRELAELVRRAGAPVLTGRSTAGARALPLRPVIEVLLAEARRGVVPGPALAPYRPILGRLVPEWRSGGAEAEPVLPVLHLAEALLRLAVQDAVDAPALLILEDLHWADPESLEIVEYLADHVTSRPLCVVCTLRTGERGDGIERMRSLVRRRAAAALTLQPLDAAAVASLAEACAGDDGIPDELRDALVVRSEGVPFFVEELVATGRASGWESVAATVPGSVVTSVELRLDAADADLRPLLLAAATVGRYFDWKIVAEAAQMDERTASALLRSAVQMQVLDDDDDGFRFRHALTRDAVLAAAPVAERQLAARSLLDLVGSDELDVDRCLLGAELARLAGEPDRAVALLTRAARFALETGALTSADRFATEARTIRTQPDDALDALLLEIAVLAGDADRAAALAPALLRAPVDAATRADRHLLAAGAELAAGRWSLAREHADAASRVAPGDVSRTARAHAVAATAAMGLDDVDSARRSAEAALADAQTAGVVEVVCEALEVIGRIERGRDLAAAEAAFQRAHDAADEAGLAVWRVRALQELGTIDLFDTLAVDRLGRAHDEALRIGALGTVALVELQLAALHLERGEVDDALALGRRCAETANRLGLSTEAMGIVTQAMAHARFGDRVSMDAALSDAFALDQDVDYVDAGVWGNAEPVLHLVLGDLPAAAAALDRAMEVVRRRPAAALPFPGLWALLRTLVDRDGATGEAARAEVASLAFDTPASRNTLLAAEAVALGRQGDAAGATARFLALESAFDRTVVPAFRLQLARLLAAPEAAQWGWGNPEGWLRAALAAFDAAGLDVLAGRCRRELRTIGAPVPRRSAVAPATVPASMAALGVTGREAEVLALVADGLTNKEIAARLVISVRTVDKHVERLLAKTGRDRTGLRSFAVAAGLRT